jgi:hypothetical protein
MADVEQILRSHADGFPFPPTPDVAGAVADSLRARRMRRRITVAAITAAIVTVGAVLAASPGARSAVLDWLDSIPGVHVERSSRPPQVGFNFVPEYGERVTLDEARRRVDFRISLPRKLGDPDLVFVSTYSVPAGVVTAVYGSQRRARAVFSQWRVGGDDLFFKVLGPGNEATRVSVGGAPGIWLFGTHHTVFFLGSDQREYQTVGALAGNTLAWQRGGMSYRLEADVPLADALDLAESVR